MSDPILILILAPLCIGLILMFFAQMARNHRIEQSANALATRVGALEKEAAEEKRIHQEKIQKLHNEHKEAIEGQNQKIEVLESHRKYDKRFIDMLMKSYVEPDLKNEE